MGFSKFCIVALVLIVFVTGFWANSFGESSTGILIPLYVFPFDDTTWQPLIDTKIRHKDVPIVAIINPFNGPGTVIQPHHSEQLPRLHAVGIKTIGYVATDWANKPLDEVKSEIDVWEQMYPGIEGIFFDEMSNLPGNESYYSELDAYAKSKERFDLTIGNPGVDTIPSYVGTVDNLVIHENAHFPNLHDLGGWYASYDKSNFSMLVHTFPQLSSSQIVSASNHFSYIYVTDDELIPPTGDFDPWGTISSHIELLAESLDMPSIAIRIDSRDLAGESIQSNDQELGNTNNIAISSNGFVVRTGPSPLLYNGSSSNTYSVSAIDFGNFTFVHWENFEQGNTRTITPTQDTTLVAFYDDNDDGMTICGDNDRKRDKERHGDWDDKKRDKERDGDDDDKKRGDDDDDDDWDDKKRDKERDGDDRDWDDIADKVFQSIIRNIGIDKGVGECFLINGNGIIESSMCAVKTVTHPKNVCLLVAQFQSDVTPNQNREAVKFTPKNIPSFESFVSACEWRDENGVLHSTEKWKETVSQDGTAVLTCIFKP